MHPVSTALLLLGYGLALPIGMRMGQIVATQHRVALAGHQVGVTIALIAWLLRGSIALVVAHGLWLAGARLWFLLGRPDSSTAPTGPG